MKELEDKIIDSIERYIVHYVKNYGGIIYYDVDKQEDRLNTDAKAWLRQQIPVIQAEAVREERERIKKAYQPAFDDFTASAKTMIQSGRFANTGSEIIENIGYMKSVLYDFETPTPDNGKAGEEEGE